jgi:flagellar biosynthesis/type III secretory pathway protein FliH
MSDRILKGEQAKKGDKVIVAARQLTGRMSNSAVESKPENPGQEPEISADDYLLPSDRARSEAERIVADAEQMAQDIAAQAESEASRKREEIESEIEQLIDSTTRELETQRESIERETRQRIEAEYRERFQAALTALERAAAELRDKREQYLTEIEQPALRLVLEVARQLLSREISRAPEFIAELIVQALAILKPEQLVTVKLHPETYQLLTNDDLLVDILRTSGFSPKQIALAVDETLAPAQFRASVDGTAVEYDMAAALSQLIGQLEEQSLCQPAAGVDE